MQLLSWPHATYTNLFPTLTPLRYSHRDSGNPIDNIKLGVLKLLQIE